MRVSEIFGPTIQGEGPFCGRRAMFVRTSGCNLACTYCDTPYTWDWERFNREEEQPQLTAHEIIANMNSMGATDSDLLVITGGEPTTQQSEVNALTLAWAGPVQIETNGTVLPQPVGATYVVSPHLANSGTKHNPIRLAALAAYAEHGAHFKFVATPDMLDEVQGVVDAIGVRPENVWIMPEGTNSATILESTRMLAPETIQRGWNLSTRLHVLIWGNSRAH